MKNLKGGYQLIDLQGNDLSSGFTLEGLHQVITLSNNKPLLVTGIVISGTKKNDVYTTAEKSETSFYFTVYDTKIQVKSDDSVVVASADVYVAKDHMFINNEAWAFSSSGTLTEAKLNKIKDNPNMILKADPSYSSLQNAYLYPSAHNVTDSLNYYEYYAIVQLTNINISVIKINKTSGAYTVTTKTIS